MDACQGKSRRVRSHSTRRHATCGGISSISSIEASQRRSHRALHEPRSLTLSVCFLPVSLLFLSAVFDQELDALEIETVQKETIHPRKS